MLDVIDFITERGGNPDAIRESQRRRYAPVEDVDAIIAMYEEHRRTAYAATRIKARINDVQKEIGPKKKVGSSSQSSGDQCSSDISLGQGGLHRALAREG